MKINNFTFQWHLTDNCNNRCKHCYQDDYFDNGVSYPKLLNYLEKIELFISQLTLDKNNIIKAHINFTGGEPFLYKDFIHLLQEVKSRNKMSFGILSNGYLLSENELLKLKKTDPKFIQISLDGNQEINDKIRGNGSFKNIISAISKYKVLEIPVVIAFTANVLNYKYFPEVVKTARKYNVYKVWSDRYLPTKENDELELSTIQVKDFFNLILKEQNYCKFHILSKTIISSGRALQFLIAGGKPYKCSAGISLLNIMPNGDIYPCRRLPIKIGNLNIDDLFEIYQKNSIIKNLHDIESLDNHCKSCYYANSCSGGLKCLSSIKFGNFSLKDPNCWI